MMAEWRVVVISDVQQLVPGARDAVLNAASDAPPGLALVLSGVIPNRSKAKFYRQLRKSALEVEFAPVSPADAPGWVMEHASDVYDIDATANAARALVSAVGTDLGTLDAELGKLTEYARERGEISADIVRSLVGAVPRENRWDWFELVGARRFTEARVRLPALLDGGESGVAVVSGLGTQLLRIALARSGGPGALEPALGARPKWLMDRMTRPVMQQAGAWTPAGLNGALSELLRADRLLKSAGLSDRQVLEELLLRLEVDLGGEERAA